MEAGHFAVDYGVATFGGLENIRIRCHTQSLVGTMIYLVDWACSNDRELVAVQVDLEGDSLLPRCNHTMVDLDGHTEAEQVVT